MVKHFVHVGVDRGFGGRKLVRVRELKYYTSLAHTTIPGWRDMVEQEIDNIPSILGSSSNFT
jgi:hypothetical protein